MCLWFISFSEDKKFIKVNLFFTGPICEICGKVFTLMSNLTCHRRTIHEKSSSSFSCTQCDFTTLRKSNLIRHMKRHGDFKTTVAAIHPPKVACREPIPNIIEPPANDNLLEQLEHEQFESMFEQNTQRGFGVTQMTSTDTLLPDEVCQLSRVSSAMMSSIKNRILSPARRLLIFSIK